MVRQNRPCRHRALTGQLNASFSLLILILLEGPEDVAAETIEVKAAHARVQERLAVLKRTVQDAPGVSDTERDIFTRLESIEARYGPVAMSIVAKSLAGDKEAAIAQMNAEYQPLLRQLIGTAGEYSKLIASSGEQEIQKSARNFRNKRLILAGGSVAAILAAIALAAFINRRMMRSLGADPRELREIARRAAAGDLSSLPRQNQVVANSVLSSLGDMQAALAGIVSRVRLLADAIEAGSGAIADGNGDLSLRTVEQANDIKESAVSMERITTTVRRNADTADQASALASTACAAAEKGGAVVADVVVTMSDIKASSHKISDIIGVIDGIAFQTNILALNAAVEAARAGEQGRGFAVVASEVRTLAQRSAQAAKEIKVLIQASVDKVEAGVSMVNDAGNTMSDMVDQVRRVSGLITEMSAATREQAVSIADIGVTVSKLDGNTQRNTTLVGEMASAAGSLNTQAQGLVEAVSLFRLPDESADVGARARQPLAHLA